MEKILVEIENKGKNWTKTSFKCFREDKGKYIENTIYYNNYHITCGAWLKHDKFTNSIESFKEHIENMIKEGCEIKISTFK